MNNLSGKTRTGTLITLAALLAYPCMGCRAPWQGTRAAGPNFDDLIKIEKRQSMPARDANITSANERNTGRRDSLAALDSDSERNSLKSKIDLDADDEFRADYEQSPPEGQAMLDQVEESLRRQSQDSQANTAKNSSRPLSRSTSGVKPGSNRAQPDNAIAMRFSDEEQDESDDTPEQPSSANMQAGPKIANMDTPAVRPEAEAQLATHTAPVHERTPAKPVSYAAPFAEPEEDDRQPRSVDSPDGTLDLSSTDFRELGFAMIHQLNKAHSAATHPDEKIDLAKKRRLLNLVLDDLNSAQEPIQELQPEAADYIRNTFQGLHDATDIDGNPVASRRLTLALQSHRKAMENLVKLAILEVQNLAFCTEVDSFGVVTKFPHYQFRADQEVLLYCELENFVSQPVRGGFETQLQGNYEIVDSNGRRVADQILPEDSDVCGNQRQDFYIAYRLHLPAEIEPGDYQFKLTIEDMKGQKFGQAVIDFKIIR